MNNSFIPGEPLLLDDVYGQDDIVEELRKIINATNMMNVRMSNILFVGYSYTQAAYLVEAMANELKKRLLPLNGQLVTTPGELGSKLNSLQDGSIVYVDISKLSKKEVKELLLSAIEKDALDIVIGKGPSAKQIVLELPLITYILYVNDYKEIPAYISDMFPKVYFLHELSYEEKKKSIKKYCKRYDVIIDNDCIKRLSDMFGSWIQLERYLKYLVSQIGKSRIIVNDNLEETMEYANRLNGSVIKYSQGIDNSKKPILDKDIELLTEFIHEYWIELVNARLPRERFKSYYKNDILSGNLLYSAYDMGIIKNIEKASDIDNLFIERNTDTLVRYYGMKPSAASWCVNMWIKCYKLCFQ